MPLRNVEHEILSSPFVVITKEDGSVVTFKKQTVLIKIRKNSITHEGFV